MRSSLGLQQASTSLPRALPRPAGNEPPLAFAFHLSELEILGRDVAQRPGALQRRAPRGRRIEALQRQRQRTCSLTTWPPIEAGLNKRAGSGPMHELAPARRPHAHLLRNRQSAAAAPVGDEQRGCREHCSHCVVRSNLHSERKGRWQL